MTLDEEIAALRKKAGTEDDVVTFLKMLEQLSELEKRRGQVQ